MKTNKKSYYIKTILILLLSISLILFTQSIKLIKDSDSTPITKMTILGLFFLAIFGLIGVFIQDKLQSSRIEFIKQLPILAWVSITSLFFCILSPFVVDAINAVDFLSITTPILTYAGLSVADRLVDLKNLSWKVAVTGVFVFIGTYLGSSLLAQLGFILAGK